MEAVGVVMDVPRYPAERTEVVLILPASLFVCVLWERYKKYRLYRVVEINYKRFISHYVALGCAKKTAAS